MSFDANTTVLIVEDSSSVRQALRVMLSNVGVTRSEAVSNAGEARNRLKNRGYDVVLCDYNLGDGMNGQELLETMRKTGGVPLSTIWIMITGERSYERVVAAAEMAPDDYILKPFTSQLLFDRMNLARVRKQQLAPVYRLLEQGKVDEAITLLREKADTAPIPQYRLDAQRLCAELLVNEGRQGEALEIYQELLTLRIIPWAKMGMARIVSEQGGGEEANALLQEIIAEAPRYTDAYDLLAQNLVDDGQYEMAADVLEKAVAISPRNFQRLKTCGSALLRCGQAEKAADYLARAVEVGRYNNFFGPDVLVDLVHACSESGQTQQLEKLQAEIAAHVDVISGGAFTLAVCRALGALGYKRHADAQALLSGVAGQLLSHDVDFTAAQRFLAAAARLPQELTTDPPLPPQWARAIAMRFAHGRHELGTLLEISRANASCREAIEEAYALLQENSNKAVELAGSGQLAAAGDMLYRLAGETLNERLAMNACALLLRLRAARNDDAMQREDQLQQLLSWLPKDNERVRGFTERLREMA